MSILMASLYKAYLISDIIPCLQQCTRSLIIAIATHKELDILLYYPDPQMYECTKRNHITIATLRVIRAPMYMFYKLTV